MKGYLLIFVIVIICSFKTIAQVNIKYGLKLPTEEELKSIPYTPSFKVPKAYVLPKSFDLSDQMPPIGDQGDQGSCTAFTISYAYKSYQGKRQNGWNFVESGRLNNTRICSPSFVFNMAKSMINNRDCDEGISFYEGFYILREYGAASWYDFPYTDADCINLPDQQKINNAGINKISTIKSINFSNLEEVKYNISIGQPVILEVILDDFLYTDGRNAFLNNGHFVYRPRGILKPENYHAMLCVGYNDTTRNFTIMNSWGMEWGNKGYVDIPYEWFLKLVKESYIMNDAHRYGALANLMKEEPQEMNTVPTATSKTSWFKEGYYREFNNVRMGLLDLNKNNETVSVKFTDLLTNKEQVITAELNNPQSFYFDDKKITFLFKEIKGAGRNPLTKAAHFDVSFNNNFDNVILSKIGNLKLMQEQQLLLDKVSEQQNKIIKQ